MNNDLPYPEVLQDRFCNLKWDANIIRDLPAACLANDTHPFNDQRLNQGRRQSGVGQARWFGRPKRLVCKNRCKQAADGTGSVSEGRHTYFISVPKPLSLAKYPFDHTTSGYDE